MDREEAMKKVISKREQRDREVMENTFHAISAALGWDKDFSRLQANLWASVRARLNFSDSEVIIAHDESLQEIFLKLEGRSA